MTVPGSRTTTGRRSLLITSAVLATLLGVLAIAAIQYRAALIDSERRDVALRLTPYTSALGNVVSARVGLVTGLQQFVAVTLPSGPTSETFHPFAAGLYSGAPGVRAIQVARGDVIEFMHPVTGNEAAIGLSLLSDSRAAVRSDVRRTMGATDVTVGGPYQLAQGGTGVVLRQAIRQDGRYWGLAAVVIDLPTMLHQASLDRAPSGLRYAVRDTSDKTFAGDDSVFASSPVVQQVVLPEGTWEVAAVPTAGWAATAAPGVMLFASWGWSWWASSRPGCTPACPARVIWPMR
jgi:sensor domain CHASE-containing protein